MKVVITGGAGFIGSHIAETLSNDPENTVIIIDNLSTGNKKNIEQIITKDNVKFVWGDITNIEHCKKVITSDIEAVCHQAALGSVPRSIDDPLNSHNSNVNGFLNVLLCAKEAGVKRVVYASSSSVYGDNKNLPKEESCIGKQLSPYAVTKHIDELYAGVFTSCYGMECIGFRYFNIFGPRQDPKGPYAAVIPKFTSALIKDVEPVINGDGTFSRDFTYIDNAVSANILGMTTSNSKCFGEAFNVGTGGQVTISELYKKLRASFEKNMGLTRNKNPILGKLRSGDVPHSRANINKAKELLNYQVLVDFETGIDELMKFEKLQKY